jgi:hypothetical protein
MSLLTLCEWIEHSSVGAGIRESTWWFPMLNWGHVLGNSLMFGTIVFVDLRLIGAGLTRRRVTDVAQQLLPWTWTGWGIMLVTGALIFSSEAVHCYTNIFFRIKFALMFLAGLNAAVFHFTVYKNVAVWDSAPSTPPRAKLAGALSLTLWVSIMIAGRAVGYSGR